MTPITLIPAPYSWVARVLAIALVAIALFATGWTKGRGSIQAKWNAERESRSVAVAQAQTKQAEHVATVIKTQTTITEDSDHAYQTARSALAAINPRRVRYASTGGDHAGVPTAPPPACQPDAATADAGSGPASAAAAQECSGLQHEAALTTLQLLHLQNWIDEQEKASSR